MSSGRAWIIDKLTSQGYSTTKRGSNGLVVHRRDLPDALVYCVGLGKREIFDADSVDAALSAMPGLEFIVVLPTDQIGNSAYRRAEESGICVAGFGELQSALGEDKEVAKHIDTQERYERRRLIRHPAVESLKRRGYHAYEIHRSGMRPLNIVTTNVYEFTVDELYTLLESYEDADPEMIVVTNPNCQGLSTDSRTASKGAGIGLILFPELLKNLGRRWK